jgi:phage-related protein
MRPAIFHPKALEAIRAFPEEVRRELGQAIFDLQKGASIGMPMCRSMPSVAVGAEEIRIKDRSGVYRAFTYRKSKAGVLIFHAFQKKTQKTPDHEIELGKKRLKELLHGQIDEE